jgi:hypothetical protein
MKLLYFNDTGRLVRVHPATLLQGCLVNKEPIRPLEERENLYYQMTHTLGLRCGTIRSWD